MVMVMVMVMVTTIVMAPRERLIIMKNSSTNPMTRGN